MKKCCTSLVLFTMCFFPRLSTAAEIDVKYIDQFWQEVKTAWYDVPQFNPSIGVLTGLKVDYNVYMETQLTVTNMCPDEWYFNRNSWGVARTLNSLTVSDDQGGCFVLDMSIDDLLPYYYYLTPQQSAISPWVTSRHLGSYLLTDASVISEFTGTGRATLKIQSTSWADLTNTGPYTEATSLTNTELMLNISYLYDIPEPATLLLLGLGSVMLRRKK